MLGDTVTRPMEATVPTTWQDMIPTVFIFFQKRENDNRQVPGRSDGKRKCNQVSDVLVFLSDADDDADNTDYRRSYPGSAPINSPPSHNFRLDSRLAWREGYTMWLPFSLIQSQVVALNRWRFKLFQRIYSMLRADFAIDT